MGNEPKERWQKKYLIMGKHAQTIELSTELGINYIPCCAIVLMLHNQQTKLWKTKSQLLNHRGR